MGRGSPIPPMLRRKIVEQYQKGVSQRKIAKTLKLSSATVNATVMEITTWKPLLSKKNIRDRLMFCRKYSEWTAEDWGKVIFSDEAPFRLFGASGKRLSCVMPTVKHPDTIHVWGCFSSKGVGSLTILPENTAMNKEWYQNSLQQQFLPTIQQQFDEDFVFQHDLAPAHSAKTTGKWFTDHGITVLNWPANSPDLNPIENLWDIVKRKLRDARPNTLDELKAAIEASWASITPQQCHRLIASMPRRIEAVISAKGFPTKY
uniref:Tc1-like transposase DDE domain-containing protein n=1 Tax=Cyprinus carpio carpio TaxID=630221 RepID=A0A9J8A6Z0_CYPCA